MKARKPPLRSCIGCGRTADKRELVRVVRDSEGETHVDGTGKANGRGAYVCADTACFEAAVRRRRFAQSLRVNLGEEETERLRREFEDLLLARASESSSTGR